MRAGDLDIPTARFGQPAWRRREKRGRPRVLLLALVVGVLAFIAAVALVGTGQRVEREVPLIVADNAPFRVRPADPGGMQVPNQDQLIYQRMAGAPAAPAGRRIEVLLPPPEAPLPVPRPVPPAPEPSPAAAAPAEAPTAPVTQPAEAEAAPGLPLPPRPPATAAAQPTAPAPPRAEGPVQVQLAAVGAEAAVQPEWNRLRTRMPDLLGNHALVVSRGERDGQPFWRVRTGGFADVAAARGFCEQVRARGFTCFVVGGT
ncbi:SPOR domain-containing protein [Elioraea sp.]|uniref:SPOR domain-containing protein n=1 Tax=Elioraea sp. TaxID=2185103 RepID=UPI003F6E45A4